MAGSVDTILMAAGSSGVKYSKIFQNLSGSGDI